MQQQLVKILVIVLMAMALGMPLSDLCSCRITPGHRIPPSNVGGYVRLGTSQLGTLLKVQWRGNRSSRDFLIAQWCCRVYRAECQRLTNRHGLVVATIHKIDTQTQRPQSLTCEAEKPTLPNSLPKDAIACMLLPYPHKTCGGMKCESVLPCLGLNIDRFNQSTPSNPNQAQTQYQAIAREVSRTTPNERTYAPVLTYCIPLKPHEDTLHPKPSNLTLEQISQDPSNTQVRVTFFDHMTAGWTDLPSLNGETLFRNGKSTRIFEGNITFEIFPERQMYEFPTPTLTGCLLLIKILLGRRGLSPKLLKGVKCPPFGFGIPLTTRRGSCNNCTEFEYRQTYFWDSGISSKSNI